MSNTQNSSGGGGGYYATNNINNNNNDYLNLTEGHDFNNLQGVLLSFLLHGIKYS